MNVRDVRATLVGKVGAVEDRARDHVFFYLQFRGKEYKGPKLSHSWRGDLDDQQIDWVKKSLQLTKRELEQLVDCSLTKEQFFEVWTRRKRLV